MWTKRRHATDDFSGKISQQNSQITPSLKKNKRQKEAQDSQHSTLTKCLVKNKDIRKFLDGIYVSDKGPISDEQ
jgi:hypothetical protein